MSKLTYKFCCLILIISMMLQGCVAYRNVPKPSSPPTEKSFPDVKYRYKGTGTGMFGGTKALKEIFKDGRYFNSVERVSDPVNEGIFIDVEVRSLAPSVPALGFGYLSVATLTILPFWSTQDGYEILFVVYRDGDRLKSYEYGFQRNSMVWLPMVLISWVNVFTPSEEGSFESVGKKFLEEARPLILGSEQAHL